MNVQLMNRLKGRTLETIGQRKVFDVLEVTQRAVIVRPHSTGKKRPIPRQKIESAYDEAVRVRKMRLADLRKHSEFSPVYIASILNCMPGFSSNREPVVIYYNQI